MKAPLDANGLLPMLHGELDVSQNGGWTFVFTTPLPFVRIGYGMEPAEMEDLWRKLLQQSPAPRLRTVAERLGPTPALPGEVHIRPRHHA